MMKSFWILIFIPRNVSTIYRLCQSVKKWWRARSVMIWVCRLQRHQKWEKFGEKGRRKDGRNEGRETDKGVISSHDSAFDIFSLNPLVWRKLSAHERIKTLLSCLAEGCTSKPEHFSHIWRSEVATPQLVKAVLIAVTFTSPSFVAFCNKKASSSLKLITF